MKMATIPLVFIKHFIVGLTTYKISYFARERVWLQAEGYSYSERNHKSRPLRCPVENL